ncbi:hypothetical protein HY988_05200 [Candidatus Micrarchaeota archaeon]|nr:hypothetical protein [Candidatus Micrarchaeota archaeon]
MEQENESISAKSLLDYETFSSSYNIKKKQITQARNWFPLYSSKELAEIAAALITDGHIDWNDYDGNPRTKKVVLYSNYKNECQWFLDQIKRVFHVKGQIIRYRSKTGFSKSDSYKAIAYCAPLARVLIKIGVPCGDKTQKPYLVPDWIMNANREINRVAR